MCITAAGFTARRGICRGAVHDVGVFAPCGDDTGTTGVFAAFLSEDFERAVPACGVVACVRMRSCAPGGKTVGQAGSGFWNMAKKIMCARRKGSRSGGLRVLEHGNENYVRPAER